MTDITEKDSEQDVKIAVIDSTLENATRRMELIHKRIDLSLIHISEPTRPY